jgi:hypothetical protein
VGGRRDEQAVYTVGRLGLHCPPPHHRGVEGLDPIDRGLHAQSGQSPNDLVNLFTCAPILGIDGFQLRVDFRHIETLESLGGRMNELATRLGSQEAGYAFQVWFCDLMDFFEIMNRRPYTSGGRQIDGSVTVSGTTLRPMSVITSSTEAQQVLPEKTAFVATIRTRERD